MDKEVSRSPLPPGVPATAEEGAAVLPSPRQEPKKVEVLDAELPICPHCKNELKGVRHIDYGQIRAVVCDQCRVVIGTVPVDN